MTFEPGQDRRLFGTWLLLAALSVATTAITAIDAPGDMRHGVALGVLLLAGAKARLILRHYLGLAASVFWTRAFDLAIGLFLALAFALYAVAT